MPRQESGTTEQVTEQIEEVAVLDTCLDCDDAIPENANYQQLVDIYDEAAGRYRTRYRCEDCAVNRLDEARFHCALCAEDHLDQTEVYGRVPDWYSERNGFIEARYYYASNNGRMWCQDATPACIECGGEASITDWDGIQEIADSPPDYAVEEEDCECDECEAQRDMYYPRCRRCSRGVVHNYSFVPQLVFKHSAGGEELTTDAAIDSTPYLGMELEMENGMDKARKILDLFGGDCVNVWLKPDGSLHDNGVEMVTHPATLEWYMEHFNWDALGQLSKLGCRAYNTSTAGIHIHISSSAFTPAHLFKFLAFHHRNPIFCQTIGQRGSAQYCSWSKWLMTRPEIIKYAKKQEYPSDRYVAVNLTESETIELRYFKGNLAPARVRKNLQWVDALYRYTKTVSGAKHESQLDFHEMVRWLYDNEAARYPDLLQFIEDRNIARDGTARVINEAMDV